MPNYRRANAAGGTYFFTVVTYDRRPFLVERDARIALRTVIEEVRRRYPFSIDAWVLLPEHVHCLWTLPEGDADFSKRWGLIKAGFSKAIKDSPSSTISSHKQSWVGWAPPTESASRKRHRETSIWQRRFWEHQIRNEDDFRAHMDYIHFNPVRHGLVQRVADWPHSTFHRYAAQGVYPDSWGSAEPVSLVGDFGE